MRSGSTTIKSPEATAVPSTDRPAAPAVGPPVEDTGFGELFSAAVGIPVAELEAANAAPVEPPPPGETGTPLSQAELNAAVEEAVLRALARVSITPRPAVGTTLLVNIGEGQYRPLMVTALVESHEGLRVSGLIACDAGDHTLPAFRGTSGISGRPDRMSPYGLATYILEGDEIGQWRARPRPAVTIDSPSTTHTPTADQEP